MPPAGPFDIHAVLAELQSSIVGLHGTIETMRVEQRADSERLRATLERGDTANANALALLEQSLSANVQTNTDAIRELRRSAVRTGERLERLETAEMQRAGVTQTDRRRRDAAAAIVGVASGVVVTVLTVTQQLGG